MQQLSALEVALVSGGVEVEESEYGPESMMEWSINVHKTYNSYQFPEEGKYVQYYNWGYIIEKPLGGG